MFRNMNLSHIFLFSYKFFTTLPLLKTFEYIYIYKNNHNSFGGTALLVHNSTPQNEISWAQTLTREEFSYSPNPNLTLFQPISPFKPFNANDLANVLDLPNAQTLVLGDFNMWHRSWGPSKSDKGARTSANYI